VRVFERLRATVGSPATIVMVNGPEFVSRAVDAWTYPTVSRCGPFAQRSRSGTRTSRIFNGKFRDERLSEHWFTRVSEAQTVIEAWRLDYMLWNSRTRVWLPPWARFVQCSPREHLNCRTLTRSDVATAESSSGIVCSCAAQRASAMRRRALGTPATRPVSIMSIRTPPVRMPPRTRGLDPRLNLSKRAVAQLQLATGVFRIAESASTTRPVSEIVTFLEGHMTRRSLVPSGVLGLSLLLVAGPLAQPTSAREGTQEEFDAKLGFQTGSITLAGGIATLRLPASFRYLGPEGRRRVLTEAWGNTPVALDRIGVRLMRVADDRAVLDLAPARPDGDGAFVFRGVPGRYTVTGGLMGGMGQVCKPTDTRLSRTVTLKVLPSRFADDPR
jgi:hypothetical protein